MLLGRGHIHARWRQIVLATEPDHVMADDDNWTDAKLSRGFAGSAEERLFVLDAGERTFDVALHLLDAAPGLVADRRTVCADLVNHSGRIEVSGLIDDTAAIAVDLPPGEYAAYVSEPRHGAASIGAPDLRIVLVQDVPLRRGRL